MIVLGVDPGAKTGWCLYDSEQRRVLDAWTTERWERPAALSLRADAIDAIVIEKPVAHGPTRPEVVETAWIAGKLSIMLQGLYEPGLGVHELPRLDVKQALTAATLNEVQVRTDATAWAALKLLHGPGSDRKARRKKGKVVEPAGPIGTVKAHERAALAVAVAWLLIEREWN